MLPRQICPGNGVTVNNQWFSKVAVWLVIALVLFTVFKQFERTGTQTGTIGYSDFLEEVRAKRIQERAAAGRLWRLDRDPRQDQ